MLSVSGAESMRKAIALIGAACAGLILAGCMPQTPVETRNSSLTQGNVQMRLVVGRTTKADVLEAFGAPNVTTRDSSGREIWSYQRSAVASQSAEQGGGVFLLIANVGGSSAGFSQTSRMLTLIITFDANDTVTDFRSRESNF